MLSFTLSQDGTKIAHQRAPNTLYGDAEKGEVWVMNADGSEAVQITKNSVAESGAELSPDNSQVLFLADADAKFVTYYNGRIFVAPARGRRGQGDHAGERARHLERVVVEGRQDDLLHRHPKACAARSTRCRRPAAR